MKSNTVFFIQKIIAFFIAMQFYALAINFAQAQSNTIQNGAIVSYSENLEGMVFHKQDARGVTTRFQYNSLGSIIEEQSAERGSISYTYDSFGNVIRQLNEGRLVFKREYDTQNRMVREVMREKGVDRKVNRYIYDNCIGGEGRLCKVISGGNVTKFAYNETGDFTKVETKYSGETSIETTRYVYDKEGRLTKLKYPTGLNVGYKYGVDGRVEKVIGRYDTGVDRQAFVIAKNISFDPTTNQITRLRFGNGVETKFDYEDNMIASIETLKANSVLDSHTFARNASGNITSIDREDTNESQKFVYDYAGRIVLERRGVDLAKSDTTSYTYDLAGNRISRNDGQESDSYTYATDANRLEQVGRKVLSYDVRGNLLEDRNGKRAFEYDVTNRMVRYHKNGELKASYDYNAFGQRIRKTLQRAARGDDSYRTLHFSYIPGGGLLSEQGRNGIKTRTFARDYVWLGSRPIAQINRKVRADGTTRKAKISYLHTDHLSTPRAATDETGAVVWRWRSDAFGQGRAERDVDGDGQKTVIRLRFAGQYHDAESGLYYNRYRDYDPSLGRYIQSDPIGLNGGMNRYTYVSGNPINYVDPTGLVQCTGSRINQSSCSNVVGLSCMGSCGVFYQPRDVIHRDVGDSQTRSGCYGSTNTYSSGCYTQSANLNSDITLNRGPGSIPSIDDGVVRVADLSRVGTTLCNFANGIEDFARGLTRSLTYRLILRDLAASGVFDEQATQEVTTAQELSAEIRRFLVRHPSFVVESASIFIENNPAAFAGRMAGSFTVGAGVGRFTFVRTGSLGAQFGSGGAAGSLVALTSISGDIDALALSLTTGDNANGVLVTPEGFNAFASFFLANGYDVDVSTNPDGSNRITISGEGIDEPLVTNVANTDTRCQ